MPTPPRRWLAFRVRTLFVVVALLSVPLAWVGYSLNWIWERHEALQRSPRTPQVPRRAPLGLWVFGEEGHGGIVAPDVSEVKRYEQLFPEAKIYWEVWKNNKYKGLMPAEPQDPANSSFQGDDPFSRMKPSS